MICVELKMWLVCPDGEMVPHTSSSKRELTPDHRLFVDYDKAVVCKKAVLTRLCAAEAG